MLMVAEMTGSIEILAPAMIAVGLAALIVARPDTSIYRSQRRQRADGSATALPAGVTARAQRTGRGSLHIVQIDGPLSGSGTSCTTSKP